MGIIGKAVGLVAALTADGGSIHPVADGQPNVGENIITYRRGEQALEEAARFARANLSRFFQLAETGMRASYLVKVVLVSGDDREHIWAHVDDYRDGTFVARLANDPTTPGYALEDVIEVRADDISDWMINTGKVRYGGYTIRAMLDDMPAEQARELRRQFRD